MNEKTLKARALTIQLCDDDAKSFWNKAASVGMTAPQLIENFIADLIYGTGTNGSDERMYAEQWFDRCGFSMNYGGGSLLQYLASFDMLDGFFDAWNALQRVKQDLADEEAEQGDYRDDEAIAILKTEELPYYEDDFMDYWRSYTKVSGNENADFEKEVLAVLEWHKAFQESGD